MEALLQHLWNTENLMKKVRWDYKKIPKDKLSLNFISLKIEELDNLWETYTKAHAEILRISTEEERDSFGYDSEFEMMRCEGRAVDAKTEMLEELKALPVVKVEISDEDSSASEVSDSEEENTPNLESKQVEVVKIEPMTINLPMELLPRFSGCESEWDAFKELYTIFIHDNSEISNIQKLFYLKNNVFGEAGELLRNIDLSDDNYSKAWDALTDCYDSTVIVFESIDSDTDNEFEDATQVQVTFDGT